MTEHMTQLLAPFLGSYSLSGDQMEQVTSLLDLLTQWNSKINLTAIRDREAILTRHFGESLFAAWHLLPNPSFSLSVTDVGSGSGFPGMPLKIWAPTTRLTLVESNHKKAAFLNEAVRKLMLSEVTVLPVRVEEISTQSDLVTLRAVERFEKLLRHLPKLLKPSARIGLLIGKSQLDSAKGALKDILWSPTLPIPMSRTRTLLIGTVRAFN